MRVLAMASQKGGSGKTTLSGHLAVQAQLAGAGPVVLIDIDRQTGFIFAGVTQQLASQLDICPNDQTITNMAMGVFSASQIPLSGSEIARATLPLEQSTGITPDAFLTQMSAGGCLSITADRWPQWQTP